MKLYPAGKVGPHGSWFSIAVQSPTKYRKITSDVFPHWAVSQFN